MGWAPVQYFRCTSTGSEFHSGDLADPTHPRSPWAPTSAPVGATFGAEVWKVLGSLDQGTAESAAGARKQTAHQRGLKMCFRLQIPRALL